MWRDASSKAGAACADARGIPNPPLLPTPQVDATRLPAGLSASCAAVHPLKPAVAVVSVFFCVFVGVFFCLVHPSSHPHLPSSPQATPGAVAEYDLHTGARTAAGDVAGGGPPAGAAYSPRGGTLAVVTSDRAVTVFDTAAWTPRRVVPPQDKAADKLYTSVLVAVTAGEAPVVFYCPPGGVHLRAAPAAVPTPTTPTAPVDRPGARVKWEGKRPLAGLVPHPTDAGCILTLGVDGSLAAHAALAPPSAARTGAASSLACLWGLALAPQNAPPPPDIVGAQGAPPPRLAVAAHGGIAGGALVAADAGPSRGVVLLAASGRAPPHRRGA